MTNPHGEMTEALFGTAVVHTRDWQDAMDSKSVRISWVNGGVEASLIDWSEQGKPARRQTGGVHVYANELEVVTFDHRQYPDDALHLECKLVNGATFTVWLRGITLNQLADAVMQGMRDKLEQVTEMQRQAGQA